MAAEDQLLPDLGRPCERDLAHAGIAEDRLRDRCRGARGDEIDDTGGHAGSLDRAQDQRRRQRCRARGFTTLVQPAAIAGASFRVIIAAG